MPDHKAMLEQAEKKIAEAKAAFAKYDKDGSNSIDETEVLSLMADMGLVEKLKTDRVDFLTNYFAKADSNGDGVLSFEEFKGFYNAAMDDASGRGGPVKAGSAGDRKKAQIAAANMDKKGGSAFPGIAPASEEEVIALSQKLNSKLAPKERQLGMLHGLSLLLDRQEQKEWFKVFALIDEDKSGRVMFDEFKAYVRSEGKAKEKGLGLKKKDISDEQLKAVWLALDDANQGCLKSDKFGKFMKMGQGDAGPTWQERRASDKAAQGAAARAEMDSIVGRDMNKKFQGISPASPDEVELLSKMLNAEMAVHAAPHMRDWMKMFNQIDEDRSGRIQFPEVEHMVRKMLGLPTAAVTDQRLAAVWLALDDDKSGFITTKEFGPFMKLGMDDPGPSWKERIKDQKLEEGRMVRSDTQNWGSK